LQKPHRIGPGRLVLVVGPSGAGKDTLIDRARLELADDASVMFPNRLVTRPPSASEANTEIDVATFTALANAGGFSLSWSAHGHHYGLPAAIDHALYEGRTVVCNVSRSVVAAARDRYELVTVVEVTAPAEVLATRIAARGRGSDGDAAIRLNRSSELPCPPDVTIVNNGPVEPAARRFLAVITG
jgi:ribose 1,5-bisphosphokinase